MYEMTRLSAFDYEAIYPVGEWNYTIDVEINKNGIDVGAYTLTWERIEEGKKELFARNDEIELSDSSNYLEHVLRSAYLFVLAEQTGYVSNIGTEEMSTLITNALCNEFGDDRFCQWVENR